MKIFFGIIAVLLLLGMLAYIFVIKPQVAHVAVSNTTQTAVPTIPVRDFAPGMPMTQKTTILIQSSDSSDIKYIVPKDQVDTYVKQLPPGFHVVSKN